MGKPILTETQKKVLHILAKDSLFTKNFYFTGGTVLAEYYLHHRLSEDLDFFSENDIDKLWLTTFVKKVNTLIKSTELDIQESFNRNIIYFRVNKEILKTEFTYYPFPVIEKARVIGKIKVDSIIDIAVNKFFTIYQKPTSRHFIDLYLLIKEKKVKWEKLPKLARVKFDTVIDPLQLGSQLVTAPDVKDTPKMLINLPKREWVTFFIEKAKELKKQIKQ